MNKIHYDFEKNSSAVFLDICRVGARQIHMWHEGRSNKLKCNLQADYYIVLKSYIENTYVYTLESN